MERKLKTLIGEEVQVSYSEDNRSGWIALESTGPFTALTRDEARELANMLNDSADEVDVIMDNG
jgi:hypothetical protein